MAEGFTRRRPLADFELWDKLRDRRIPLSFDLEITARCHNDCRHCYINLPASDRQAEAKELSAAEIFRIAEEAIDLGALWCLVTGGEPLLRRDFEEIYTGLARRGLLVSVFTTACLVTPGHVELFRAIRPRQLDVTVYGVTQATYEAVTRKPGSYAAFRRGLDLLLEGGIPVKLKTMALKSNLHEIDEIQRFCQDRTQGSVVRFDVQLHLRYDGSPHRNDEIRSERLSPAEAAVLDASDPARREALGKVCQPFPVAGGRPSPRSLFYCGAGESGFSVAWDGTFQLCSSLHHPDTVYDLRRGSVKEAWETVVPRVRAMRSESASFDAACGQCVLVNLCLWCPAHGHLETGKMEGPVPHFCEMAQARARAVSRHEP